MQQWRGILFRHPWCFECLPYFTLISLIAWTFLIKKVNIGIGLMAIGATSFIIGLCFITWMFASRPYPQQRNFPSWGCNSITDLITLVIGAFSIQNMFVEVLRSHPFPKHRTAIISIAYALGTIIYMYIGVAGGYGILDRVQIVPNSQTLMGYFYADRWQPFIL